jgi:hypothetical protein
MDNVAGHVASGLLAVERGAVVGDMSEVQTDMAPED